MTHLTRGSLDAAALLNAVAAPERGGTALFLGTVRDEGGQVTAIEYSAYDTMADAELDRIVAEARDRWPDARVAVQHRLGRVPAGEASIAIAAAAPHRDAAFATCRYVIEEVKRRLPVWKRELHRDGTAVWVDPQGQTV
jgi:molybdopterin synthase catalytic subunit